VPAAPDGGPVTVSPIQFSPSARAGHPDRSKWRLRPAGLIVATFLGLAVAALWFVFTARAVTVEIEPEPDRMFVSGGLIRPKIGGRYLLRPGDYTVEAELKDYRRLESLITVSREADQAFRFSLELLPGRLTVTTGEIDGAVVVIDDLPVGNTPLTDFELAVGEHEVVVRADRHQVHSTTVVIDRPGGRWDLSVDLIPAWAAITIRSEPSGAEVLVDGARVGTTPLTTDLGAGPHRLQLGLAEFKPMGRRILVVADQAEELPVFRLDPADARLALASHPSGATVTVDGIFAGQTPIELSLKPATEHLIKIAKVGHETRTESVRLEADASEQLTVTLDPKIGQVRVDSTPTGAEIIIDGVQRGTTSQTFRLSALSHTIEVRKDGFKPFTTTVVPEPELLETIHAVLEGEARPSSGTPATIATSQGATLKLIAPGRFSMGASRREPGRRANESIRDVQITRPFYLSIHEVTNKLYREFSASHSSGHAGGRSLRMDAHPVVRVTWEDAARFSNWLSKRDGLKPVYEERDGRLVARSPFPNGYRLPTEAEWALAARMAGGSTPRKYIWGDNLPVPKGAGNFGDASARDVLGKSVPDYHDGFAVTSPVGSFDANPLGLYDLGGNVAEWVHDGYTIYPPAATGVERDPVGPAKGEYHVIRGASWMDTKLTRLRLSYRDYGDEALSNVGFRIARSAD